MTDDIQYILPNVIETISFELSDFDSNSNALNALNRVTVSEIPTFYADDRKVELKTIKTIPEADTKSSPTPYKQHHSAIFR